MKRFKNILCAVEPGKACKPSMERVIAQAEKNQTNLPVEFEIRCTLGAILNQIDCSVLTIKPRGFETPVTLEG